MSSLRVRRKWTVQLRSLRVAAKIGVNPDEAGRLQPVDIDATLHVELDSPKGKAAPSERHRSLPGAEGTVCYATLAEEIERISASRHWPLAEDLAGTIATWCLEDKRVLRARIRVRKPDAIPEAKWAGVQIEAKRGE